MVTVVGTIVNENLKLVGLVFNGHPRYFNEISEEKTINKAVPLSGSKTLLSRCKNFRLVGNSIESVNGKDMLSDLDMSDTKGNKIDNRAKLAKRIIVDDKVCGYLVEFGFGGSKKFRTADIIVLSTYFKPVNFLVKSRDGSSFISGKPGMQLSSLPAESRYTEAYKKRNAKAKAEKVEGKTEKTRISLADIKSVDTTDMDLLGLFDVLDSNSCFVLGMGDYKNTMEKLTETDSAFTPLSSGLKVIGAPKITHSKDKLKANVLFRKPGYVGVEGMPPVMAFTWTERTLIMNNENHMPKIGIAVPMDGVEKVVGYLKGCNGILKLDEVDNKEMEKAVRSLTGNFRKEYRLFSIDLSGMKVLSNDTVDKSILTLEQLTSSTIRIESNKVVLRGINSLLANLNCKGTVSGEPDVADMFSVYSEAMIDKLVEAKVDVKTGAYNGVIKATKSGDAEKVVDETLVIEYGVFPTTITNLKSTDIIENGTNGKVKHIDNYIKEIKFMIADKPDGDVYKILTEIKTKLEDDNNEITKALWLHKMAITADGNRQLHSDTAHLWFVKPNRSKKGDKTYFTEVNGVKLNIKVSAELDIMANDDPDKASKTKKAVNS